MEYSIDKAARMAGISTRALRHYDQIGLLKPRRMSGNGYRVYGPDELDRLQQIMLLRELGLELEAIKECLETPGLDRQAALQSHLEALRTRRARLDALIATVEKTIRHEKGEIVMTDQEKFEGFKQAAMEENERKYGAEIRKQYGTERVEASNKQFASLTQEQYEAMQSTAAEIGARLQAAVHAGLAPAGEEGRAIAALHRDWLGYTWPSYSVEAHRGLGDMYLADERFTAYYDKETPGCAQFLRDAIYAYAV